MVKETQRVSTTGTAQYLVADGVVTLMGETGTTVEPEVREEAVVKTPTHPPTNIGRNFGAAVRTVVKKAGQSRKNDVFGDGDKIFVRPYHQGTHSKASHWRSQDICEDCHRGTHSEAMPSRHSQ